MSKTASELSSLDRQQLQEKIELYRQEIFRLRLAAVTSYHKDFSVIKKTKKNLARALTYWRQKFSEAANG